MRVVALDLNDEMLAYAKNKAHLIASRTPGVKQGASAGKAAAKQGGGAQRGGGEKTSSGRGFALTPAAAAAPAAAAVAAVASTSLEGLEFVKGDMSNFEVQGPPFDMVMCLLGTFSHMTDNKKVHGW